jgi:hypothetical protein
MNEYSYIWVIWHIWKSVLKIITSILEINSKFFVFPRYIEKINIIILKNWKSLFSARFLNFYTDIKIILSSFSITATRTSFGYEFSSNLTSIGKPFFSSKPS